MTSGTRVFIELIGFITGGLLLAKAGFSGFEIFVIIGSAIASVAIAEEWIAVREVTAE